MPTRVLAPLWTEVKTANGATQFINAIQEAVAQRNEAEQGRVWNTITIFMALSGLLSRMAGGDGTHPSAMKSTAWAGEWRECVWPCRPLRHPPLPPPLVSCVYFYCFLYMCGLWHVAHLLRFFQAWRSRHSLQQDTSEMCCRSGRWQWRQIWNEVDNKQMSPRICGKGQLGK